MASESFMEDRDLVISILARFKEVMEGESTIQKYDETMDPNKADPTKLTAMMNDIINECAVIALKDHGIDAERLTVRLPNLVRKYHGNDKEAIIDSGSLFSLHHDYKDLVEFLYIYIQEAHPRDGWAVGAHYSLYDNPKNLDERIAAARRLIEAGSKFQTFTTDTEDLSKVRMVVDTMENVFAETYAGQPERICVIEDGKMAYIGEIILQQLADPYKLITDHVREWLESRFPAKK
ncbi:type II iodothyronine deiodinase-like [Ptychodera flava]|uniref:type II iodothyronine deiodinase-like n=1 Tax=Ptychodera flava TaxID=63121 RepID=UPI00396A1C22